jgi:hypothetical protein
MVIPKTIVMAKGTFLIFVNSSKKKSLGELSSFQKAIETAKRLMERHENISEVIIEDVNDKSIQIKIERT